MHFPRDARDAAAAAPRQCADSEAEARVGRVSWTCEEQQKGDLWTRKSQKCGKPLRSVRDAETLLVTPHSFPRCNYT